MGDWRYGEPRFADRFGDRGRGMSPGPSGGGGGGLLGPSHLLDESSAKRRREYGDYGAPPASEREPPMYAYNGRDHPRGAPLPPSAFEHPRMGPGAGGDSSRLGAPSGFDNPRMPSGFDNPRMGPGAGGGAAPGGGAYGGGSWREPDGLLSRGRDLLPIGGPPSGLYGGPGPAGMGPGGLHLEEPLMRGGRGLVHQGPPLDLPHLSRGGGLGPLPPLSSSVVLAEMPRSGEAPLPVDASPTLFIDNLPEGCSRREASHIFRPFIGFKEVRLVHKEVRRGPAMEKTVLCFVDFADARCAATAMEALQGYRFDESDFSSPSLRIVFARQGPRHSFGGPPRDEPRRGGGAPPRVEFEREPPRAGGPFYGRRR